MFFLHHTPLLGLIALPVLAPIVALLQLLFPGLMRNQYQQYKTAIHVLLTQSTVMFLHWLASLWFAASRPWWLRDEVLGGTLLAIALVGIVWALIQRRTEWEQTTDLQRQSPARIEFLALGLMTLIGGGWALYQFLGGGSFLDPMLALSVGCVAALLHLAFRVFRPSIPRFLSTELALLSSLLITGIAIAAYTAQPTHPQRLATEIKTAWPTYRGGPLRTGSDVEPILQTKPKLLWSFEAQEKKGRVRFHSTPTIVDGVLFIGGMKQILTLTAGVMYGVSVNGDPSANIAPGQFLWQYDDNGNLKPVFSSPSVLHGQLYFGEGYHQDANCRLFCLDARSGTKLWQGLTQSHVESPPTLTEEILYIGAGDDGLLAYDLKPAENKSPVWRRGEIHIDSSPLVTEQFVIAGSVLGDLQKEFALLAVDRATGRDAWKLPTPYPVPGSPAFAEGMIYASLGRGKMDHDDENPIGAVWAVDAARGEKSWEFPLPAGALNSPVVDGELLLVTCRDGQLYALDRPTGNLRWKINLQEPIVTAPAVNGTLAVVVTVGGMISGIDLTQGEEIWRIEEHRTDEEDACSSPVIAGGKIFVAIGNQVHCLGGP